MKVEKSKIEKSPKKPLGRKAKKTIISAAITVLSLTAIILLNIIASALTEKYSIFKTDITSMQA